MLAGAWAIVREQLLSRGRDVDCPLCHYLSGEFLE